MDLREKKDLLDQALARQGRTLVAYSGGVDSAYLAYAASRVLGQDMLAVIADSPSLARVQLQDAIIKRSGVRPGGLFVLHAPKKGRLFQPGHSIFPRKVSASSQPHTILARSGDAYPLFYLLNTRAAIRAAATNLGLVEREFLPHESASQPPPGTFRHLRDVADKLLRLRSLLELLARFPAVGLRSAINQR